MSRMNFTHTCRHFTPCMVHSHTISSFTRWVHTISLVLSLLNVVLYPGLIMKAETSDSSIFLLFILSFAYFLLFALNFSSFLHIFFSTASSSVSKCFPTFLPNDMISFLQCCKKAPNPVNNSNETWIFFVSDVSSKIYANAMIYISKCQF